MTHSHPAKKLTLSQADDGLELTHEEFAEADYQEPWRYERVNGRLVVMTPPGFEHHVTTESFRNYLVAYQLAHPEIIEHVFQESWAIIDEDTERFPDLAVYLRSETEQPPFPERVPDLIFEIVSSTAADRRRDYQEKRGEYERIGVREYVIVDRFDHRLLVLRLENAHYTETELHPTDHYNTPLLSGLNVPLTGII